MSAQKPHLVVLHGVNLDMLGERPSEHYGSLSLAQLEQMVAEAAGAAGWRCLCEHTNHEGSYVELIHKYRSASALIVNPGAWTHYSYAIRDALELVGGPVAEVHLSDVDAREEWRRRSVIRSVVSFAVSGKGPAGYLEAFSKLAEMVAESEVTA